MAESAGQLNNLKQFAIFAFCFDALAQIARWACRRNVGYPVCPASDDRDAVVCVNENTFKRLATEVATVSVINQFLLPLLGREVTTRGFHSRLSITPMCPVAIHVRSVVDHLRFKNLVSFFYIAFSSLYQSLNSVRLIECSLVFLIAFGVVGAPLEILFVVSLLITAVGVPIAIASRNLFFVCFPVRFLFQLDGWSGFFTMLALAGSTSWLQTVRVAQQFVEVFTLNKMLTFVAPFHLFILPQTQVNKEVMSWQ